MVPLSFAGETFAASPDGALYWPAQQALLVADLHLEKASWFARLGQFLPPYDSHATLTALAAEAQGFKFDRHAARNELQAATFGKRRPAVARLVLSPTGTMAIEVKPL